MKSRGLLRSSLRPGLPGESTPAPCPPLPREAPVGADPWAARGPGEHGAVLVVGWPRSPWPHGLCTVFDDRSQSTWLGGLSMACGGRTGHLPLRRLAGLPRLPPLVGHTWARSAAVSGRL